VTWPSLLLLQHRLNLVFEAAKALLRATSLGWATQIVEFNPIGLIEFACRTHATLALIVDINHCAVDEYLAIYVIHSMVDRVIVGICPPIRQVMILHDELPKKFA